MKPALSVIVFTVLSGVGLGTLALSAGFFLTAALPGRLALVAGLVGLALTTIGLLSSTLHLANRKNAWRALSRLRSSWLSREALFALLLYPVAGVYLWQLWRGADASQPMLWFNAMLLILLALATLFATGMIYAVLRTIPQWNSPLVPLNYLLLGLASGGLVLQLIAAFGGQPAGALFGVCSGLLALAALAKTVYFLWFKQPTGPTINSATGFSRAQVKLLDIGHSGPTFNTREFGYRHAPTGWLRLAVLALLFAVPLAVLAARPASAVAAALALFSATAGLLLERWLFFAEAQHSVNVFHGRQRV